ncbi:MAG: DnaJ domain-containing protein [Deltaproteobacteria bacterium]|nr:DnaJ domain-containing protein [Deltaproteobacteria bacterium]
MIKKYLPWLIAFLYLINPCDVLPDCMLGPGWLDDLAVFALVLWWTSRLKKGHQASNTSSAYAGKESAQDKGMPEDEDPYSILGLQPGASKKEIKQAYKRLVAKYHPDKVQHLGSEFQDLAHKKFVAIQKAYETLMK